jgi:hypothetical protein
MGHPEVPANGCDIRQTEDDRARWNNVLAPVLLPLASAPLGPMTYSVITAKKS